ncbi:uncharacterized protein ASCRUDRAFT_78480 [Ascoidea rubescens DSM 1968]|uniref:Ubiquitin-like domain-containing protein n=1 Tax=Ascoidea rubescens DSM 1968 TaxID=1344418 RepID=A0A1D2VP14_9ASCO|nr:hypothetical protein ASCRUDRAFT_78480 [Ascoidea rubescens DSM 1968]ODV63350.1 hypothetical protein ASCRUDRAFT_78480 [Ascoidea rubescens DSM 1968]
MDYENESNLANYPMMPPIPYNYLTGYYSKPRYVPFWPVNYSNPYFLEYGDEDEKTKTDKKNSEKNKKDKLRFFKVQISNYEENITDSNGETTTKRAELPIFSFPYESSKNFNSFLEALKGAYSEIQPLLTPENISIFIQEDNASVLPSHWESFIKPDINVSIILKKKSLPNKVKTMKTPHGYYYDPKIPTYLYNIKKKKYFKISDEYKNVIFKN